jgi:signal transduction histidine kinase
VTNNSTQLSARSTLLVCDDEEGPRQSLRILFKDEYNILLAESGAKAVELARTNLVDAVVCDIRMAGLSGIDVLNQLKQIDPAIEVIMLTAFETVETARQALRLGACDYLNKPFDISTVRTAVAKAMERRSLSNEIRANNEKLLELKAELKEQKMQEEILRTRGEIYGSIIHDINGPLTVISGFIEMISQRIGSANSVSGEDLELVKDRLARIIRQLTNCIDISRRYLSFLRERSEARTQVGANQLLTDLWELLKFHPSLTTHQLLIKPLAEDILLDINGTDLLQILLNLSINAFQCSPTPLRVEIQGQIQVTPLDLSSFVDGPEDRFINREGFRNSGPLLTLSVQDNGPGISPDIIPTIFSAYVTTKSDQHGNGLGLAIVQRLVKESNAALHLHTKVGQGTVFTIFLPTASPSELTNIAFAG